MYISLDILLFFLRNRFKLILSMYLPTRGIGVVAAQTGSNRTRSRHLALGVRLKKVFLKLNPMGKYLGWRFWNSRAGTWQKQICNRTNDQSLREVAVGSYSLRACTIFSAKTKVKDSERSMEFIGFYIYSNVIMERK